MSQPSEECIRQADGRVKHQNCHTYIDGTITNPRLKGREYIVTGGVR